MRYSCYPTQGHWYKGNLHTHTTCSDGGEEPAVMAAHYRMAGYDFLSLTDHWHFGEYRDMETDSFLLLSGVEIDVSLPEEQGLCHHIVGIGLPGRTSFSHGERFPEWRKNTDIQQMIGNMRQGGLQCIYAHPLWSRVRMDAFLNVSGCMGIEIYNHMCQVYAGNGDSRVYYDHLMWRREEAWCFASDDAHNDGPGSLGGFIMVKSPSLTHEAILDAITKGLFYASSGPLIEEFYIEDDTAVVRCSPCRSVTLQGDHGWGAGAYQSNGNGTHFTMPLRQPYDYLYAICEDVAGRRAWSQPIKLMH